MKKIIFLLFISVNTQFVFAQQDPLFTHFAYAQNVVNPAYSGSRDHMSASILSRLQWLGFNGAPMTHFFTLHTPIFSPNFGTGIVFLNEQIGPSRQNYLALDFSYEIKLSSVSKLRFGLKFSGEKYAANLMDLETEQLSDNAFSSAVNSKFIPNAGFGMLFKSRNFFLGLSVPRMLENKLENNATSGGIMVYTFRRHYHLVTGHQFAISPTIDLRPALSLRVVEGAPIQFDLMSSLVFSEKISAGLNYRLGDALGVILGMQITEQFNVGYSFDFSFLNTTGRYNAGSHEIFLRYDFNYKSTNPIVSPRYF